MPDLDGFEATRTIKEMKPDLPIIAVTAYAMTGDEIKTIEAGCDGYVSKPFTREQILEAINQFLID
jgi:CheY-like chemotaxis protein